MMTGKPIYLTQTDAGKIRELLRESANAGYRGSLYIKQLEGELNRAVIVEEKDFPQDAISMNSSVVLLDLDANEQMELTLVFPDQADVSRGRISVLAPIGAAMVGYRAGDTFEWNTPEGKRRFRVEKVIQQTPAQ